MIDADIKIVGLGLVVNTPTALIYKALTDAGYKVNLEDFRGQHQYISPKDWPEKQLENLEHCKGQEIRITVDLLPWGG